VHFVAMIFTPFEGLSECSDATVRNDISVAAMFDQLWNDAHVDGYWKAAASHGLD
jgi:hypothetical protein